MPDFRVAGGAACLAGIMLVFGALVSWLVKVPSSVTIGFFDRFRTP